MIWGANSSHMEKPNANEKEQITNFHVDAKSFKRCAKVDFGVGHEP
jgi:hypothetical protein